MIFAIIEAVKNAFNYFSEDAMYQRKRLAMEAYFSQATDIHHLEQLEKHWFKNNI